MCIYLILVKRLISDGLANCRAVNTMGSGDKKQPRAGGVMAHRCGPGSLGCHFKMAIIPHPLVSVLKTQDRDKF